MTEPLSALRAASVPEKPTLDGLEDKWAAVWQERGHLRVRPRGGPTGPRRDLLDRHPAAHRVAGRCTSGTSSATRTPTHRPLPADAGQRSSTRWGGTTTACPPSGGSQNYYGVRCDPTLPYDPEFSRRRDDARGKAADKTPSRGRNFVELCDELTTRTRRRSRRCGDGSASRSTGRCSYQTIDDRSRSHGAAGVPAQPGPRRGVPGRGAEPLGRHLPHRGLAGRARGPRLPRRLPPHRRSTGPDGDRCRSRPPAPS